LGACQIEQRRVSNNRRLIIIVLPECLPPILKRRMALDLGANAATLGLSVWGRRVMVRGIRGCCGCCHNAVTPEFAIQLMEAVLSFD
jgi:hypothetical protein